MFYFFSYLSKDYDFLSFFRLFDSILFRSMAAMLTSLLISLFFGNKIIKFLYKRKIRDIVRDYSTINVSGKNGTTQMGGVLIIFSLLGSVLLWSNLNSSFTIISIIAVLWFGFMGAYDDLMKVKYKDSDKGLSQKTKILLQIIFATSLAFFLYYAQTSPFPDSIRTALIIPFFKSGTMINLQFLYIPFVIFTVLAISNAVNFADGLDGLAIVPSITTGVVYAIFAYLIGNVNFSNYLLLPYVSGTQELTVILSALFGAGLGFLWFNCYPASVFMGDTGAMAIGGLLSVIVILTKQELLFLISGGIFVAEAFSVTIQEKIGINKTGRRYFFRAPLHDAFRHRGMSEPKIVQRVWIISIILSMVSLISLKIR